MPTTFLAPAKGLKPVEAPESARYYLDLPEGSPVHAFLKRVHIGSDGYNARRKYENLEVTEKANLRQVETAAKNFRDQIDNGLASARRAVDNQRSVIQTKIAARLALYKPSPNAAEIRAVLRAMPEAEREKAVRDAFATDNTEVLSSVVNFNPLMTGIRKEVIAGELEQYQRRNAPEEVAELEANEKASRYLDKFALDALSFKAKLFLDTESYAAERAAAEGVLKSYDQTFDGPATNPVEVAKEEPKRVPKPALNGDGSTTINEAGNRTAEPEVEVDDDLKHLVA